MLQGLKQQIWEDQQHDVAVAEIACIDLQVRLKWKSSDDEAGKVTGRTLLWHAALANNPEAVKVLLRHCDPVSLNAHCQNPNKLLGERMLSPLMCGMCYASFEVVQQLLAARAAPEQS